MKFEKWKKVKRKGARIVSHTGDIPDPPEDEDCILITADEERQSILMFDRTEYTGSTWDFREHEGSVIFWPSHYMIVRAPWSIG